MYINNITCSCEGLDIEFARRLTRRGRMLQASAGSQVPWRELVFITDALETSQKQWHPAYPTTIYI